METTHFENVDLLKSLMGGGRPQVPASRRPALATAPTPPRGAVPPVSDSRLSHDALGISTASSRPTTACEPGPQREASPRACTLTTPHGGGGAPPPYQTHAPPAPPRREAPPPPPSAASAGAGSVRSASTPSSPALSLASLPGYEAAQPAAAPPPSAASPSLPSLQEASSGLKALFQAPMPLSFRAGGKTPPKPFGDAAPTPTPRRRSAPPPNRGGGAGPGPSALLPMTSVASFRSLVAEGGAIPELEGDSCLVLLPPRPASYSAGAGARPGGGDGGGGPRRISSPLPQTGAARHGGRSQLFVYKPRQSLPLRALVADAITESPADTLVFELEGSGGCRPPRGPPPRSRLGESPEEGEEDAGAEEAACPLGGEEKLGPQKATGPLGGEERLGPQKAPSLVGADASGGTSQGPVRRNEVESAAWHRRTKMFQV